MAITGPSGVGQVEPIALALDDVAKQVVERLVGKNSTRRPIISGTRWFPIDVRTFRSTLLIEAMEPSTILNGSSGD